MLLLGYFLKSVVFRISIAVLLLAHRTRKNHIIILYSGPEVSTSLYNNVCIIPVLRTVIECIYTYVTGAIVVRGGSESWVIFFSSAQQKPRQPRKRQFPWLWALDRRIRFLLARFYLNFNNCYRNNITTHIIRAACTVWV